RAALLGGLIVAGGAGAGTGVWERLQKGEHDLRFLGMAAIIGAAAGFGAAKAYQPEEDESTVISRAEEVKLAIESKYNTSSPDSPLERAIGIESVKNATKRDKRRVLGRTALWMA